MMTKEQIKKFANKNKNAMKRAVLIASGAALLTVGCTRRDPCESTKKVNKEQKNKIVALEEENTKLEEENTKLKENLKTANAKVASLEKGKIDPSVQEMYADVCNSAADGHTIAKYDFESNVCYISVMGNPNDEAKFLDQVVLTQFCDLRPISKGVLTGNCKVPGIDVTMPFLRNTFKTTMFLNGIKIKTVEEDLAAQCEKDKNCKCEENQNGQTFCEAHIKDNVAVEDLGSHFLVPKMVEAAYSKFVPHNEWYNELCDQESCDKHHLQTCRYDMDVFERNNNNFVLHVANMRIVFDNVTFIDIDNINKCKDYCAQDKMVPSTTTTDFEEVGCGCVVPTVEQKVQESKDKHAMLMKGMMYNKMFGRI